jgi:hypothetical protein
MVASKQLYKEIGMDNHITPADLRALARRAFAIQFVVACCYALALAPLRRWYERHHLTELTVIGGVLLSMAPANWLARRTPTNWQQYEQHVMRGFATAAVPITLWQAWLFVQRLRGRDGA